MNNKTNKKEKGAAMIILALIIATLMTISIIGISQLTISKKKTSKSLDSSETAYQKADEAAECALWGRKAALENGSTTTAGPALYKMFAKNIKDYYCDYYQAETFIYKQLTQATATLTDDCASPLLATAIFTKGSQIIADNFSDASTKTRAVGATVNSISTSSVIKPFIVCNKLATAGTIKTFPKAECPGLVDDTGPNGGIRGWLGIWPECSATCYTDLNECAYYDSDLDNAQSNLYGAGTDESQGAHWCWTLYRNLTSNVKGSMCHCMEKNTTAVSQKYWDHPDVIAKQFCHPCYRLYDPGAGYSNNSCGGGGKVGNICAAMANVPALFGAVSASVWGPQGKPALQANQGVLKGNNSYSCYCRDFWDRNPNWCDAQGILQPSASNPP